jgi:putative addiction module killer protein
MPSYLLSLLAISSRTLLCISEVRPGSCHLLQLKEPWTFYAIYGILGFSLRVARTDEFEEWYASLTGKGQGRISARIQRIEDYDHFGDAKNLGEGLAELRWANGWRVYYTETTDVDGNLILILLGGMKNGQKKDIKKARILVRTYDANQT